MSEEEKKAIRMQFQKILNKLVNNKIAPTGTAILAAEQPMILLFEELMNKIEKQQAEIEKKDNTIKSKDKEIKLLKEFHNKHIKIIDKMAGNVFLMNGDRGCTKQEIIDYFTKLVEEENK